MQNTTQTTIPKSIAKTPHSAKYPLNIPYSNLYLSNSERNFLRKNQSPTSTPQNGNNNIIPFQKRWEETTKRDHILLEQNRYNFCLVNSAQQRIKTSELIKHMYASRGYCTESATDFFCSPSRISFEASIEQCVVGTLTVGHDSKDGLFVDMLYKEELQAIRAENRKVCELSKLAINPQHSSKELLASLFNLAYINARIIHRATDFVIEVNPRHAGYYKRLLGFRQIGELRICQRVKAPAVLLHLELDYVDAQVDYLAGSRDPKQRSLYTYFLTKYEETKVANKIQRELAEQQPDGRSQTKPSFSPNLCVIK